MVGVIAAYELWCVRVSLMTKVGIRVIIIRINFILVGPLFLPMAVQTAFYCTVLDMNKVCKYGNNILYEILVQHG